MKKNEKNQKRIHFDIKDIFSKNTKRIHEVVRIFFSKNRKRRQGLVRHFFQKSMKLKIWNYIYKSTRNSTRNTKNTVEGGLACVVCEIWAKNGKNRKRRRGLVRQSFLKKRKRSQGLVRHIFQKSMKLKIWNY